MSKWITISVTKTNHLRGLEFENSVEFNFKQKKRNPIKLKYKWHEIQYTLYWLHWRETRMIFIRIQSDSIIPLDLYNITNNKRILNKTSFALISEIVSQLNSNSSERWISIGFRSLSPTLLFPSKAGKSSGDSLLFCWPEIKVMVDSSELYLESTFAAMASDWNNRSDTERKS